MSAPPAKKGKGLSFEEKRHRLQDFFLEKRDFFQLKELEKLVPKEKGIVVQTVKDVLQSLVDDRLVCAEKIGTSNYFWAFPSAALVARQETENRLNADVENLTMRVEELENLLNTAGVGREDTAERQALIEKVNELACESGRLDALLEEQKENDPLLHVQRKREASESKKFINRWTDNIITVQSWCSDKFGVAKEELREAFGIPEELDYV